MSHLSLFKSSVSFAAKEFKNKFWFWQRLMLKIWAWIVVYLLAMFASGIAGFCICSALFFQKVEKVNILGLSDIWKLLILQCASWNVFLKFLLVILIAIATLLAVFYCFYKIGQISYSVLANVLDVAESKQPRGLVLVKNFKRFFPIALIIMCSYAFVDKAANFILAQGFMPFDKDILVEFLSFIMILFMTMRLFWTSFILIDEPINGFAALRKSWNMSSGKSKELFLVVLCYLQPQFLAWFKMSVVGWKWMLVISLFEMIIFTLFFLMMAKAYVILKCEYKAKA
jgi:hypothetical protein